MQENRSACFFSEHSVCMLPVTAAGTSLIHPSIRQVISDNSRW